MQAITVWTEKDDGPGDFNWLGQAVVGALWFINNVRIKIVGVIISGLMVLMLVVGLASSLYSGWKVGEIQGYWRAFDTGAATKQTLLNDLRERLG
ncbi:MAG TPA: hypothetical protein VEB64_15555, partial [Azospirillaceae bacterium]|nr:hypothetical protein [Azospirillaceae bacterium]